MKVGTHRVAPLRYFKFILVVLTVLFVVAFVLENQQAVSIKFLGWFTPELPVSIYMLLSLLIGLAVGPLLGWYANLRRGRSRNSIGFG